MRKNGRGTFHGRETFHGRMLVTDAIIAAILLFLDQLTKYLAIVHLKGNPAIVLIDGVLELQYVENRGIAFSLFQNRKIFIQ